MSFNLFKRGAAALLAAMLAFGASAALAADAPKTERLYLSGKGPKDGVAWDFTIGSGRRAGEKATIPVPSQWQQHGFGTYNYGYVPGRSSDKGVYSRKITVPADWRGKRVSIVFEAVMTEAAVKVNGTSVGRPHQGAFTRFSYDITRLVRFGEENAIEVEVSENASDSQTDRAERGGDYWVLGGIFRPVWLEVSPTEALDHVAIDARADGAFTADVRIISDQTVTRVDAQILDAEGKPVGQVVSTPVPVGGSSSLRVATRVNAPKLWTAETPNLYSVKLTLYKGEVAVHERTQRFGFRTFELRVGEGLYLNGQRVLLKGVNRHSFRPATGRSLDREDNYADVKLIKSMNMNAVRMSHYPPDPDFLEAADELGLYVLNELSGWQQFHGTEIGRQLVRELVERDVNHPSILFWDNGNENGWNRELDGEFALYDPQKRLVLHPWDMHENIDTKHYSNYADLTRRLAGKTVFMATEIMHALYDGGGGAALEDYWTAISASPVGGGMFIWAFADEGLVRTDKGGAIDTMGTLGADGLVGPNHEKEGSYYTVKDVWSPIQITDPDMASFSGKLAVANRYDFTSLDQTKLRWKTVRFPGLNDKATAAVTLASGDLTGPAIRPHGSGEIVLPLPANWRSGDAVVLTALGPDGEEIWTWTWMTKPAALPTVAGRGSASIVFAADAVALSAGGVTAKFDPATGLLKSFARGNRTVELANGPRLTFARPPRGQATWATFDTSDMAQLTRRVPTPGLANVIEIEMDIDQARQESLGGFKLEISSDGTTWKEIYNSKRRFNDGNRYVFAPQVVAAVRVTDPRHLNGQPLKLRTFRLGYEAERYPTLPTARATITTGRDASGAWLESKGAGGLDTARWTLRPDGTLQLDYAYNLEGDYLFHGVTFDGGEANILNVRSLGDGPSRVWSNRVRGVEPQVREAARSVAGPGNFTYPEFQGYFSGLRWARFNTQKGPWTVTSGTPSTYLRVGTPLIGHGNPTPEFPTGDISFLEAIPGISSKGVQPAAAGPQGQPAKASGTYKGSLLFTLPAQ